MSGINGKLAQSIEHLIAEEMEKCVVSVGFKRLTKDAVIPTKAHASDSGFDLYASEDVIIEPGATVVVPTGIAVILPEGFEATVRPRSGVTSKTKLRVQLGTIDNGYAGEIGVIVDNISQIDLDQPRMYPLVSVAQEQIIDGRTSAFGTYQIHKGERIAQLVITRLPDVEAVEVFDVGESSRGAKGFGSSGVRTELLEESVRDNAELLQRLAKE